MLITRCRTICEERYHNLDGICPRIWTHHNRPNTLRIISWGDVSRIIWPPVKSWRWKPQYTLLIWRLWCRAKLMNWQLAGLVFMRGGPSGNSKKPGHVWENQIPCGLSEMWNTIKHHAHRLAYQKVAEHMLAPYNGVLFTSNGYVLLSGVQKSIRYQNWESGRGVNI